MKRGGYAADRVVGVVLVWAVVLSSCMALITYASKARTYRAVECSQMLHGYKAGTLVPITEDASVEIGACLLEFNQPLTGEKP